MAGGQSAGGDAAAVSRLRVAENFYDRAADSATGSASILSNGSCVMRPELCGGPPGPRARELVCAIRQPREENNGRLERRRSDEGTGAPVFQVARIVRRHLHVPDAAPGRRVAVHAPQEDVELEVLQRIDGRAKQLDSRSIFTLSVCWT